MPAGIQVWPEVEDPMTPMTRLFVLATVSAENVAVALLTLLAVPTVPTETVLQVAVLFTAVPEMEITATLVALVQVPLAVSAVEFATRHPTRQERLAPVALELVVTFVNVAGKLGAVVLAAR